ncbi:hypothetical protein Acsp06_62590 [Actinomycetospora sp. NBRC 106375]|uniref:hypothetical protein n=1 Tax=Actinomycetospora sp. NBRC 106375 TaxID=3032207 RepID=UPI0024A2EA0D|nr:hypothetical protein [Actinomycetospora sp. NBRC 106375]GLZ50074.1 hypothetical protein Acsp06_62590 [Actinomycetospora sp. NBRC 106375]
MTVQEYFETLGVSDSRDLRRARYRVINAYGFVGFQLGEAALVDTGHYRPEAVVHESDEGRSLCDRFYIGGLPDGVWRDGVREVLVRRPRTARDVLATDVNRWRGTFTGKDGIHDMEDLKDPAKQTKAVLTLWEHNHRILIEARGIAHTSRSGPVTTSGALAAAHLCGPHGVVRFLAYGRPQTDEFKTSLERYLTAFSGYRTPYEDIDLAD